MCGFGKVAGVRTLERDGTHRDPEAPQHLGYRGPQSKGRMVIREYSHNPGF